MIENRAVNEIKKDDKFVIVRDGKLVGKIEIISTTILTSIAVYQKEFPKPSEPFKRGDKVMKIK